jgi:hypothetical protein
MCQARDLGGFSSCRAVVQLRPPYSSKVTWVDKVPHTVRRPFVWDPPHRSGRGATFVRGNLPVSRPSAQIRGCGGARWRRLVRRTVTRAAVFAARAVRVQSERQPISLHPSCNVEVVTNCDPSVCVRLNLPPPLDAPAVQPAAIELRFPPCKAFKCQLVAAGLRDFLKWAAVLLYGR